MKKSFQSALLFILTSLSIMSCQFEYAIDNIRLKEKDRPAYELVQKVFQLMQKEEIAKLTHLCDVRWNQYEYFDQTIQEGKVILDTYEYPDETDITVARKMTYASEFTKEEISFTLPFKSKVDQDDIIFFHVTVSRGHVQGMVVGKAQEINSGLASWDG